MNYDIGLSINLIDDLVEKSKNSQLHSKISEIASIAYSFQIENVKAAITDFIKHYKF
ncbi:MAG: hypothetical protein HC831_10070 [Chloroflexia bacterium]|nr:hypothetical protein [Chloroflexia bacterium]